MVQEVQKQADFYKQPNEIEWIWYIERKLSYRTQIRDKGWAWGIVAEISLATSTETSPWQRGHFNDSTVTIGQWWSMSGYTLTTRPWTYLITWEISTHNSSRLLDYFEMYLSHWWTPVGYLWHDGNNKKEYYGCTAYELLAGDLIGLHFQFSWGSATTNITWTLRFIQF